MTKNYGDMSRLEREIAEEWVRAQKNLEPQVRAALKRTPLMDPEFAVTLNVAQNVARLCLESVIDRALPQEAQFFTELATRLAAYVITAMHPDDQERAALTVGKALLSKLADMQSAGHVIQTEWVRK